NSRPARYPPLGSSLHHVTVARREISIRSSPSLPRTVMTMPGLIGATREMLKPVSDQSIKSAVILRGFPMPSRNSTRITEGAETLRRGARRRGSRCVVLIAKSVLIHRQAAEFSVEFGIGGAERGRKTEFLGRQGVAARQAESLRHKRARRARFSGPPRDFSRRLGRRGSSERRPGRPQRQVDGIRNRRTRESGCRGGTR